MLDLTTEADLIHKEYLNALEKRECRLFPGYNLKQILFNETLICQKLGEKYIHQAYRKSLLMNPCVIEKDIRHRRILTFYTKNYRIDHDGYWDMICADVGEHDDIRILSRGNYLKRFAPFLLLRKLGWYRIAYEDLDCIENSLHRMYLAVCLVSRKWTLDEIEKLELNPKACMCYFDSSRDENVVMQYFKKQGAVTITNQHGQSVFESFEYDRLNQSQLLNFKCDYFLAKGEKQREQLIAAGVDGEKVRLIGIVGDTGSELHHTRSDNNNVVIGVYLDCPTFSFAEKTNFEMISIVQKASEEGGYKYFLKPHPADVKERYLEILDGNCIGIFGKEDKLRDTFDKASIAVISASATYVDACFYGIRCLKYDSEISYPIAFAEDCFSDTKELKDKTDSWIRTDQENKRKYLENIIKIYNSGWEPGKVQKTIETLLETR